MTLAEFRKLTAHFPGHAQMLCGGVRTAAVTCDRDECEYISVDDDADFLAEEQPHELKLLFRESNPDWHAYVNVKGTVPAGN